MLHTMHIIYIYIYVYIHIIHIYIYISCIIIYIYIYIYIYICIYILCIYMCVCIYIYIYICIHLMLNPDVTKVKLHWKMPLKIPRTFPVKSTGQWQSFGNYHWQANFLLDNATEYPLETATEDPQWFLRCRFLACNLFDPKGAALHDAHDGAGLRAHLPCLRVRL